MLPHRIPANSFWLSLPGRRCGSPNLVRDSWITPPDLEGGGELSLVPGRTPVRRWATRPLWGPYLPRPSHRRKWEGGGEVVVVPRNAEPARCQGSAPPQPGARPAKLVGARSDLLARRPVSRGHRPGCGETSDMQPPFGSGGNLFRAGSSAFSPSDPPCPYRSHAEKAKTNKATPVSADADPSGYNPDPENDTRCHVKTDPSRALLSPPMHPGDAGRAAFRGAPCSPTGISGDDANPTIRHSTCGPR